MWECDCGPRFATRSLQTASFLVGPVFLFCQRSEGREVSVMPRPASIPHPHAVDSKALPPLVPQFSWWEGRLSRRRQPERGETARAPCIPPGGAVTQAGPKVVMEGSHRPLLRPFTHRRSPGSSSVFTCHSCQDPSPPRLLKNIYFLDRGAWWATIHGVAKSWT